jgi:hypothetical protein
MPEKPGIMFCFALFFLSLFVFAAYQHRGERDSASFLKVHPAKAGGKLDQCALCHSGGQFEKKGDRAVLGSCQWCHFKYGYDKKGPLAETLNAYGMDYLKNGRDAAAIKAIAGLDSDGDGYGNGVEIAADRFPGDGNDDPLKAMAPFQIYTRSQLEALPQHRQFLLQNSSKGDDGYAEFSGVTMETLLLDAGILDSATGITVFAPDGWSQYHPLRPLDDPAMYQVFGTYPEAEYHFSPKAASWCDYGAPSCVGRKAGEIIQVPGGLRMLLALKREGMALAPATLSKNNKLDGEGPYRVIVPQKTPSPPDQSSKAKDQKAIWPYRSAWDHNAGSSTRSVTMIRVEPLPAGTTDLDIMEAGWRYIEEGKIIIYGAIGARKKNTAKPGKPFPCSEACTSECEK